MAGRLMEVMRSVHPARELPDDLEPVLAEITARAAAAWPTLTVDRERFVRAIAERLAADAPVVRALEAMQTSDLYLACGCTAGDPASVVAFESCYGAVIERAIATIGVSAPDRADLGQIVRERLLVSPPRGDQPRIGSFSARGSLAAWVRVVAAREALRVLPRFRREVVAGEDELADLAAASDDPQVGYLKRLYREDLKRALHAAVAALEHRQRLLLRQHALDGLGIDQLAAFHGMHRATAARQVQAAREAVRAGTMRELIRRLRLSPGEIASVFRLIQSQLDLSLPRVLLQKT